MGRVLLGTAIVVSAIGLGVVAFACPSAVVDLVCEEVPEGKVLCEYCVAKCCRYFALPIDTPETFKDWEFVRWYLLHDHATVFIEDDEFVVSEHARGRGEAALVPCASARRELHGD